MHRDRETRLWERIYNLDGHGLSDYLNDFFRIKNACWKSTQHGEKVYLIDNDGNTFFSWGEWHKWREEVSYYFSGMCDAAYRLNDENWMNVFVYKLSNIMFQKFIESASFEIHAPKNAGKYLFC